MQTEERRGGRERGALVFFLLLKRDLMQEASGARVKDDTETATSERMPAA